MRGDDARADSDPSPVIGDASREDGSTARAQALRRQGVPLPAALVDPHEDRLWPAGRATATAAHRQAVSDGADGYVDPTSGLFCFTAAYHWAKGACCELGCRHCPWVDADARLAAGPTP